MNSGIGWLDQVAICTKAHREAKAKKHDAAALRKERAARMSGLYDVTATAHGKWHRDRAKGQRNRPEKVAGCQQTDLIILKCNDCGVTREKPARCRSLLLCPSCRGKIASEKRGRYAPARVATLGCATKRGLLRRGRKGGRFSEKFCTLTAPHLARHSVRERIMAVHDAWPFFLKRLNEHKRAVYGHEHVRWFRNLEWTPGSDGKGHPHIHFWIFGPFLPQRLLHAWWAEALESVGYTAEELVALAFPFIEEIHDGERAALELIKYITKDIVADGSKVDPIVYAEVYKALDGVRTTQASRGFLKLADKRATCPCGAQHFMRNIQPIVRPAPSLIRFQPEPAIVNGEARPPPRAA